MSRVIPLRDAEEVGRVGGKAASLGKLLRAGFDVPAGFVIETQPAGMTEIDPDLADAVARAYAALGGTVAVRSSATAEDGAAGSMAGQFETVLNVTGVSAVLDAVRHCLVSAASERVRAYAAEKRIDPSGLSMAVVVQRQVAADVAGVMFTASPDDAHPRQMLVDAAWGLGESVVSGRVQPDVLRIAFDNGHVVAATIAKKTTELTAAGEHAVAADRQSRPCLTSDQVHQLWQLGGAVEAHFGAPQDVEWAFAEGRLHLLQSRPVTTHADAAIRAALIDRTREELTRRLAAGEGPWVLHNLAETLPHPSPLAWDVVRRFMSASGAYGTAYRAAGFAPADDLADRGFLDLIGGRIYMDAARAPRMFWPDFPYAYDADVLRRRPDASQQPPTRPTGSIWQRLLAGRRIKRTDATLRKLSNGIDRQLRPLFDQVFTFVADRKRDNLQTLTNEELAIRWRTIETRVMDDFGPNEILAGLGAGQALDDLRSSLAEHVWDEDPLALAGVLSSGGPAHASLLADARLYEVGLGQRDLGDWLAEHGHRGVGEFDLASPRWREQPDAARAAASRLAAGTSPEVRHAKHAADVEAILQRLCGDLSAADAGELRRLAHAARAAIALREDAKDALIRGYDLLRDVAIEAGRRLGVGDRIFNLERAELLASLATGYAPIGVLETRQRQRSVELRVHWPPLLDADGVQRSGGGDLDPVRGPALAVSAGTASGPALVVRSPNEVGTLTPGYVLVCPSTDPSWTPLLAGAAALVVECGGVLSHGAVVARELGVPAVVLADATRRFASGDVLHVDGTRGDVTSAAEVAIETPADSQSSARPIESVPPVGGRERRSWQWASAAVGAWGVLLLLTFSLPGSVLRRPAFSVLDRILWPVSRAAGWPLTVTLIAAATAFVLLLLQRTLTDNTRLLVAKRRGGAGGRVLAASLVPTALLLGPLVLLFVWLGERATPSSSNLPSGAAVRILAMVDGEWQQPVTLAVPENITIDQTTPAIQSLPPLRTTLENLLSLYRRARATIPGEPWQLAIAPDPGRQQAADDLAAFLNAKLPPQAMEWTLRPTTDSPLTFNVVATAAGEGVTVGVALGNDLPPVIESTIGRAGAPIRSLEVVRPKSLIRTPFFAVFGVDVGWVGVYVVVYVATLLLLRRVLNVV